MSAEFEPSENSQATQIEREAKHVEEFKVVLKELRKAARLSQAQLAEKAGFDHSFVSRLESGDRGYSEDTVEAFIRALELDTTQADRLRASAKIAGEDNTIYHEEAELLRINRLLRGSGMTEADKEEMRVLLYAIGELATRLSFSQEKQA